MIANQDEEMFYWLDAVRVRGGSFLSNLAITAFAADWVNYAILRPVLLEMKKKYPEYSYSNLKDEGER